MATFEELKGAYETEIKSLNEAVQAVTAATEIDEKGNVTIPETGYNEVKRLRKNVSELEGLLEPEVKSALEDWSHEGTEGAERFAAPLAEQKSVADTLFDSEEYKDMINNRRFTMRDDVALEMRDIVAHQTKDVFTAMGQGTSPRGFGIIHQELPFVNHARQVNRVRDLFPQASTTANLLEYFKSVGFVAGTNPNNANFVRERAAAANDSVAPAGSTTGVLGQAATGAATDVFGVKPKSNIAFTSASDPIKTIAHWIPAHRNALADQPQFRSIIDNELLYGLALKEDDALLNGNGADDTLQGLINRTGIQTYNGNAVYTDQLADQLRRSLTLCELSFFPASGFILHPVDWEKLELTKDSSGGYILTTNVAVGAQKRVWQVPVVSTPAMTAGKFLTGAWGQAAQVYDREQANIRVTESHADFFIRNAVVVLAEERLGLTVPRPEGIVYGTFDYSTTS